MHGGKRARRKRRGAGRVVASPQVLAQAVDANDHAWKEAGLWAIDTFDGNNWDIEFTTS